MLGPEHDPGYPLCQHLLFLENVDRPPLWHLFILKVIIKQFWKENRAFILRNRMKIRPTKECQHSVTILSPKIWVWCSCSQKQTKAVTLRQALLYFESIICVCLCDPVSWALFGGAAFAPLFCFGLRNPQFKNIRASICD